MNGCGRRVSIQCESNPLADHMVGAEPASGGVPAFVEAGNMSFEQWILILKLFLRPTVLIPILVSLLVLVGLLIQPARPYVLDVLRLAVEAVQASNGGGSDASR